MKQQLPPNLKRRYNICCRLRKKGVEVTTDAHAIEVTHDQYEALPATARRYCDTLVNEYHFVIQLKIPDVPLLPDVPVRRRIGAEYSAKYGRRRRN